jgi:hypothetical protein
MRRNVDPGFSKKAVRDQEPRIMQYVDLLVQRLFDCWKDGPQVICAWCTIQHLIFLDSYTTQNHLTALRTPNIMIGKLGNSQCYQRRLRLYYC